MTDANLPVQIRTPLGRFAPGTTGNPGGRIGLPADVRQMLEDAVPTAVTRLLQLLDDEDGRLRLAAATALMDRLYGRPSQAVDATIKTGTIQEAHLKALNELRERRLANLAVYATATAEAVVATIITPGEGQ